MKSVERFRLESNFWNEKKKGQKNLATSSFLLYLKPYQNVLRTNIEENMGK